MASCGQVLIHYWAHQQLGSPLVAAHVQSHTAAPHSAGSHTHLLQHTASPIVHNGHTVNLANINRAPMQQQRQHQDPALDLPSTCSTLLDIHTTLLQPLGMHAGHALLCPLMHPCPPLPSVAMLW
jgi:hypothetical protein